MSQNGLYSPEFERENCGFGLIAHMDDKPSHGLVRTAIESLARMTHRGGISADGKSGDGCGLLLKKPDEFFRAEARSMGIELGETYAVGMLFLSQDEAQAGRARETLEEALRTEGVEPAGWREVPTNSEVLGEQALESLPVIEQIFVRAPGGMGRETFNARLFVARRRTEKAIEAEDETFYVASLASEVISYKGLMMPDDLEGFFLDLHDDSLASSQCVYHQRFSTNTLPEWRLAQPFRMLAHNGEINTIRGNRNWARARAHKFATPNLPDMEAVRPLVADSGSDSNSMDNMLEAMVIGGIDIFRALRLVVPPAWQNIEHMDDDLRAFYEYHSMHMEPWDGPAGLVMTDGRYAVCGLDRNGLRPSRWVITKDRHFTVASEIGVYDYAPEDVVRKGRLKPGQAMAVDTRTGELLLPEDIDALNKNRQPYREWMRDNASRLESHLREELLEHEPMSDAELSVFEKQFQITFEERDQVLRPLAQAGQEAVGSMGDDTPIAVLSQQVRPLYDYFRQQFAQVTNPPIDPLREAIVMSLETCLGRERNLFQEGPEHAQRLVISSPVLSEAKFKGLLALDDPDYAHAVIRLDHARDESLDAAIDRICDEAAGAVRDGKVVLVLSDRELDRERIPVHALLATGAVHHRLIADGLRCDANIVVETGTARDSHHFAVLIGYGATAVYPYLAYESLQGMIRSGEIKDIDAETLGHNYRQGINKGLKKILSKMGISAIASYRGAQLFEAIGLHDSVVERCFTGTTCRIQGAEFEDLEQDQRILAGRAWNPRKLPEQGGLLKFIFGGEYHAYNPDVVRALQSAVETGDKDAYAEYARLVNDRPAAALRDLFRVKAGDQPVPLEEVEPAEAIFPRFDTAAMSLGALSPEAHETLAEAMNRLGGRSNSGEGGEDPQRFGTDRVSRIKQVASGRFGVTPHYLRNADVIQIKMAQGAKPGEGGQLPGHKVNKMIARLRYSNPGVSLISPPPHHDIYSIEDLAQLIFDLKQVNPDAQVSVKLVSEPGVGTVAAGVAKAYADLITISGYDGGTGASPLTSVRYAGSPFELGLSEAHQTLRRNDLRGMVRLQTDGGIKTGLDIVKAAIFGAESFGFGTAPMIAMGCKYLRICHLNNCATGVATQNDVLRGEHFKGDVEKVINYFRFVAEEVREWLAKLGVRQLTDLIGRYDLLERIPGETARQKKLDLSPLVTEGALSDTAPHCCVHPSNEPFDKGELAEKMVETVLPAIEGKQGGTFDFEVRNTDRSIGARVSGEIAQRHGNRGMEDAPITLNLKGTVGQSFGVFNAGGLQMNLEGDANDYVGKGMAGGRLVIRPPAGSAFRCDETPIMGNTCLYGATGGQLLASGMAGERFAVRNSGAHAVVEGCGDHGCEYMTGGVITVLGQTGINFGAGMTGGFAFVLDEANDFVDRYNHELIDVHRVTPEHMEAHRDYLRSIIETFVEATGSPWGKTILENFSDYAGKFWLVKPKAAEIDTLLDTLERAA